jgi:hypothetical protein
LLNTQLEVNAWKQYKSLVVRAPVLIIYIIQVLDRGTQTGTWTHKLEDLGVLERQPLLEAASGLYTALIEHTLEENNIEQLAFAKAEIYAFREKPISLQNNANHLH